MDLYLVVYEYDYDDSGEMEVGIDGVYDTLEAAKERVLEEWNLLYSPEELFWVYKHEAKVHLCIDKDRLRPLSNFIKEIKLNEPIRTIKKPKFGEKED